MPATEHKPRLRRLEFVFSERPLYFVTTCTADRKRLLANEGVHSHFRVFCEAGMAKGFYVGRYVLMPDHLHVFVAVPDEYPQALSFWMQALKRSLTTVFSERNIAAPHWQKGFFDHIMRSGESHAEKWEYVRQNPVRAGLVPRCEEWPYQGEIAELRFD